MTGNIALDVAIGLVFVFLLYSLLASIIAEMIASFFGLRARTLHKGIVRMLEEEKEGFFKRKWPLVLNGIRDAINDFHESLNRFFYSENYFATEKFYDYPLVKYLGRDKHFSKPSYISGQTFSKVLIDLLKKGQKGSEIEKIQEGIRSLNEEKNNILKHKEELRNELDVTVIKTLIGKIRANNNKIHGGTAKTDNVFEKIEKKLISKSSNLKKIKEKVGKKYKGSFISGDSLTLVESFLNDANNDIEKFKILLENWFDTTMQRTASWYKRKNQFILMLIGFAIAVFFNVSTIEIANKLSKDDDAREKMVQLAMASVKENSGNSADKSSKESDSLYLLKAKERLNEDINKANNILGFSLPDSLEATKIVERPLDLAKLARLKSIKLTLKSKPKQRLIDSIYSVEFPNAYLAEHAASFYTATKKIAWWKFWKSNDQTIKKQKKHYVYKAKSDYFWNQFWGYLLTALAISLGATFWFDLLNKLIKLRSSVQQSQPSPSENTKKVGQPSNIPLNKRVG